MKFQNGLNQEAQIQINSMSKDEIEYKKKYQTKKFGKEKKKNNNKKTRIKSYRKK